MTLSICPICEKGTLVPTTYEKELLHRGKTAKVEGLLASRCQECGELTFQPEQIKANQSAIAHARKELTDWERTKCDRLTSREIVSIREQLHLTQMQASKVLGGGANAFSKYERGDVLQSEPMDLLLRCVREVPEASQWLLNYAMEKDQIPKRHHEQPGVWKLQRGFNPVQEGAVHSSMPTGRTEIDSPEWTGKLAGAKGA